MRGAAAFGALLVLLAAAAPAAAQRLPRPTGKCQCNKVGGIPATNKPVCGADLVTYGNECVAKCANVLIAYTGSCRTCKLRSGNCQCQKGYNPVCAFGLTWISKCDADCGSYTCPQSKGVCRYNPSGTFTRTPQGRNRPGDVQRAANKKTLPSVNGARYSYTEALHKVLIFVESMRSGVLNRQRLAWRSDSCKNCRGPRGEDLSTGYYEAGGSYLKLGLVESFCVTMLSYAVDAFPAGFTKANNMKNAIDAIQWGTDYLVKAHSAPNRFVAVLGNSTLDFQYYGSPERYDTYVKSRPSCYIDTKNRGSEIAGEAAAALAASTIIYRRYKVKGNSAIAKILTHAKQLYVLATRYPGSYKSAPPKSCLGTHQRLYSSQNGYNDELAWAAAWLFKATRQSRYLSDARKYYNTFLNKLDSQLYSFETGNKLPALTVLMGEIDPSRRATYLSHAKKYFRIYLEQIIQHTPRGLALPYHWGGLRPTTQMAFLALKQSKQLRQRKEDNQYAAQLFNYAEYQINYVLGDSGRSWLVGYGSNYPKYIWHKPSYNAYIDEPLRGVKVYAGLVSQKTDGRIERLRVAEAAKFDMEGSFKPQRFIAYGALYGAPLPDDNIVVGRKDFTYAETTTDGVTGVAGAFAGLAEFYRNKQGRQNDCGLNLGWSHPNARETKKSINNVKRCRGSGKK